jgi:hypothetical protein
MHGAVEAQRRTRPSQVDERTRAPATPTVGQASAFAHNGIYFASSHNWERVRCCLGPSCMRVSLFGCADRRGVQRGRLIGQRLLGVVEG